MLRFVSALACTAVVLTGCISKLFYFGDGHLTDNSPLAGIDRYVVEMGPIDARKPGVTTYHLGYLPSEEFILGLELTFDEPQSFHDVARGGLLTGAINLELRGPGDNIILSQTISLDKAGWSQWGDQPREMFAYGRTRFTPAMLTSYTLTARVVDPERSAVRYHAMLVAKGGGWEGYD